MVNPWYLICFILFLFLCFQMGVETATSGNGTNETAQSNSLAHVGLVLDLNSPVGAMANVCVSMALSDFYARHSNYQTRLRLHTRGSEDVLGAASAVVDLLKNVEVQAIIGPQRSTEATFMIELGQKAHVPIISFSATSLSLSPAQSPYFIRTAQNDSSQVKGITAIVQEFGWHEVVLLYEDTEYGNGIIPYLTDAFQEVDIQVPYKSVIPTSAPDFLLVKELNKLVTMKTRVFLVHMTTALGSRLFELANKAGMMSEGYAWLITDGLSNLLDAMDPMVIDSMEGVLGLRPYVPKSKELEIFKIGWKMNFSLMKPNSTTTELNIFGLWAYDTVWALAMAVERIGLANSRFTKVNNSKSATDLANLGISEIGPRLLNEISNTKLKGLSGEFHLVNGQLQLSALEIFNVIRKGQTTIGYWTPEKGLSPKLASTDTLTYSSSTSKLKKIIWPGKSTIPPKGLATLRIGVPLKKGFKEFVDITDPHTNKPTYKGFSIDVFHAVWDLIRTPYYFIPVPGSYDDHLRLIYNKTLDAVVGDTAIVAYRTEWVDFTLPYSESGVSMLVPVKHDKRKNMWIFVRPFSWDLWLAIVIACIFTGLVIRILEHRVNREFRGPPNQQLGMILSFPFSSLFFPQREMVVNNHSRFVVIIWLFLAFILMQSYTASLSSMLTVDQLQPTVVDVKELIRKGYNVGCQNDSFVKTLLLNQLNFNESKIKPYNTMEEYHEALSSGTHNGGVAAVFDQILSIKLFLNKYGSGYMMAGPIYKTDGLGFAFSIGSPLVAIFSRAILNFTQGKKMKELEKKYFGYEVTSQCQSAPISSYSPSLNAHSFGGLFIITGIAIFLALFWSIIQKYFSSQPSNNTNSRIHSTDEMDVIRHPKIDNSENHSRISNQNDGNVSIEEEEEEEVVVEEEEEEEEVVEEEEEEEEEEFHS